MNSYITWPYQIADHYCRITLVYDKVYKHTLLYKSCVTIYCGLYQQGTIPEPIIMTV